MAYDMIGIAIGIYEDSSEVNQFSSKFDAYLRKRGDDYLLLDSKRDPTGILNWKEWKGLKLFVNEGNCMACHVLDYTKSETALSQAKRWKVSDAYPPDEVWLPPQLTDYSFDNLGVPINPENTFYEMDQVYVNGAPINPKGDAWIDFGLGGFLEDIKNHDNLLWQAMAPDNDGKHKVPTLRNLDKRPSKKFVKSYTHNGYFKTLKGVVHFYNTRDRKDVCDGPYTEAQAIKNNCWPAPEGSELFDTVNREELGDLGLSGFQEDLIVAFLKTLTDGGFEK